MAFRWWYQNYECRIPPTNIAVGYSVGATEHVNMNCPGGLGTSFKTIGFAGFRGPGAPGTVHIQMLGVANKKTVSLPRG